MTDGALRRFGNGCGIAAPVLWAAAIVLCGRLRPGFDHAARYISELGERGSATEFLMRYGGFVPTGLMHAAFGAFLWTAFEGDRLARFAGLLVVLNGLARIGAGAFACDPGCAGTGLGQRLHGMFATAGFFALIAAVILAGIALYRRGRRGLGAYSIGSGIAGLAALGLMSAGASSHAGLYERVSSGALSLWVFVMAVRMWQDDARANPDQSRRAG